MFKVGAMVLLLLTGLTQVPMAAADEDWPAWLPNPLDAQPTQNEQGGPIADLIELLERTIAEEGAWITEQIPDDESNPDGLDDVLDPLVDEVLARIQGSNDCVIPTLRVYPFASVQEPSVQVSEEVLDGTVSLTFRNGMVVLFVDVYLSCLGPDAAPQSGG